MMASFFSLINTVIPFSDPSRAIWKDVFLTITIASLLYFGPQLQNKTITQKALNFFWLPSRDPIPTQNEFLNPPPPPNPTVESDNEASDTSSHDDFDDEADTRPLLFDHAPVFLPGAAGLANTHPQAQQLVNGATAAADTLNADAAPRPGHNPAPRPRDPNRTVGAKKARSLARRNQNRAYNEFMREQGDSERARNASLEIAEANLREEEARRRKMEEEKIAKRYEEKRREKKVKIEEERLLWVQRVSTCVGFVRKHLNEKKVVPIVDVIKEVGHVNDEWVERVLKVEGVLGTRISDGKKTTTIVTKSKWLVRIDEDFVNSFYNTVAATQYVDDNGEEKSSVEWSELGKSLQSILLQHSSNANSTIQP